MKKDKDISEAQFIRDLKTVCPDISKEDIEWHVNLSRQTVDEKIVMDESEIYEIVMIQPRSVKADPYTLSLLKLKTQADYDKFLETHEYVSERTLDSGYIMKTYQEKM
jgi:tRNA A22 N-methylase